MNAIDAWETEGGALLRQPHGDTGVAARAGSLPANSAISDHAAPVSVTASGPISSRRFTTTKAASRYPKFRNDRGIPEIRIGVREFNCIGVSPPYDHPHVYIDMGGGDAILCPYCATLYRYDPQLAPFEADPPDCLFVDPVRAEAVRDLA